MNTLNVKEKVEILWALVSAALGFAFSLTQLVPDLGQNVSSFSKFVFGFATGGCAGATFFLMGVPVIEVVYDALKSKGE